jgi:hypothetical protein
MVERAKKYVEKNFEFKEDKKEPKRANTLMPQ